MSDYETILYRTEGKIGRITRYETKNYVGNTMIVDLNKASNPGTTATTPTATAAPVSGLITNPGNNAATGAVTTPPKSGGRDP